MNIRVTWTTDPAHTATLSWDTLTAGSKHVLYYDTHAHAGKVSDYAHEMPASKNGVYKELSIFSQHKRKNNTILKSILPKTTELYYHHVELKNLQPDTTYFLMVKSDEQFSRELHFTTAPDKDKKFKLIFGGDSRTDIVAARAVCTMISRYFEEDDSILALLHGGDYANRPNVDKWKVWLDIYSKTTTASGRLLPIIPVRGNHEGKADPIYDQAYNWPGGVNKNYYVTTLSPEVGIVILNSEIEPKGLQQQFLVDSLGQFQDDNVNWQLAAYHTPLYPAVKKVKKRTKKAWVPIFEKFDLNLVLECDGHNIKRTVPIRADKVSDDGIVYLGEGGMGAPQRSAKQNLWYLQKPGYFDKGHHIMTLEFSEHSILYTTIKLGGQIVDSTAFKSKTRK